MHSQPPFPPPASAQSTLGAELTFHKLPQSDALMSVSPPGPSFRLPQQEQLFPVLPQHSSAPAHAAAESCLATPARGAAGEWPGQGGRQRAGGRHHCQPQPLHGAHGGRPDGDPGRRPADAHQRDPGESERSSGRPASERADAGERASNLAALHQPEQVRMGSSRGQPCPLQQKLSTGREGGPMYAGPRQAVLTFPALLPLQHAQPESPDRAAAARLAPTRTTAPAASAAPDFPAA